MDKIGGIFIARIMGVANEVAKRCLALPGADKHGGGCIGIIRREDYDLLLFFQLGNRQYCNYKDYCQADDGFISRQLGKIMKAEVIGGGGEAASDPDGENSPIAEIWPEKSESTIAGYIEGFGHFGNEAIGLVTWLILGWMSLPEAEKAAAISKNTVFKPLLEACQSLSPGKIFP